MGLIFGMLGGVAEVEHAFGSLNKNFRFRDGLRGNIGFYLEARVVRSYAM